MSEHENVSEKLLRAEYGLQIESLFNVKKSVTFERPARLFETKCAGAVSIGFCSYVNEGFVKNTTIGRYCCIASVMIGAPAHPTDWLSVNQFQYAGGYFKSDPVAEGIYSDVPFTGNGRRTAIGNDVWIGQNAVIMQGVKIGDGAIVAANAVVTKDVAPYSIVGGVPARHIRYRFGEEVIARLLNLRWWRYLLPASLKLPFDQIERCLDRIENLKAAGELALNKPQTYVLQRVGKTYEVSKKKPKPKPSEAA